MGHSGGDSADVVVIGAGVVGVACALELAARRAGVVVLERGRVGHACSYGNAGWLAPSLVRPLAAPGQARKSLHWLLDPESPFAIKPRLDLGLAAWLMAFLRAGKPEPFARGVAALVELSTWSVDAWESLAARSPEPFGYARAGLLAVFETHDALGAARVMAAKTAAMGVPFEEWTSDEVRAREPAVRGAQVGGISFPRDAQCEPHRAVAALAGEARRAGVTFVEDAEVLDAECAGGSVRSLVTTRGRFAAKDIVLAAGAWSGSLAKRFGLHLPMLGGKGYTLLLPRSEPHPARSIFLAERKIAVNPHEHALRISGTLELVSEDLSVGMRRVRAIERGAREMLSLGEGTRETEIWRGLRPCTPDGMPAIGLAGGFENLWLATGHQMTGLKTSLGTGRLLAELMCGESPTFDPRPFRADRYRRRR